MGKQRLEAVTIYPKSHSQGMAELETWAACFLAL